MIHRLKYGYSSQKRNSQTNAQSFPSGIYPRITLRIILWILVLFFWLWYRDKQLYKPNSGLVGINKINWTAKMSGNVSSQMLSHMPASIHHLLTGFTSWHLGSNIDWHLPSLFILFVPACLYLPDPNVLPWSQSTTIFADLRKFIHTKITWHSAFQKYLYHGAKVELPMGQICKYLMLRKFPFLQ